MGYVAPGAIPPKWPSAVEDSGGQVFNVKAYGATGNGTTDDTTAIQAAITAATTVGPTNNRNGTVFLPPGNYKVSSPLNFTNITTYSNEGSGIILQGSGPGATRISVDLSTAEVALDFTGTTRPAIRDLWITGNTSGSQTCAILFARSNTLNQGDESMMSNVVIDGTWSIVTINVYGSDLAHWVDCGIGGTAPIAVAVTTSNQPGITSPFQTFATVLGNTLFSVEKSEVSPGAAGTCAWMLDGYSSYSFGENCYTNLTGTTPIVFYLNTPTGGKAFTCPHYRIENNNSTVATSIVYIPSGTSFLGELKGNWVINDGGSVFEFADTTGEVTNADVNGTVTATGTGTPTMFGSVGGSAYSSRFHPYSGLGMGTLSHAYNCEVIQGPGATEWTFPAAALNSANIQLAASTITMGNVSLADLTFGYTASGATFTSGSGAPGEPGNRVPVAGDFYFRTDTPSTANQRIYICTVGGSSPTWVGIL